MVSSVAHRPDHRARLAKQHRPAKKPRRKPPAKPRSRQASAISNGRLLPTAANGGVDGRSTWVRRVRDLIAQHTADLGGVENISSSEQALVRRCAVIVTELERREVGFAQAEEIDDTSLAIYQTTSNSLLRIMSALGLQRRAREIGPTLSDILRQDQQRQREQRHVDDDASQVVDVEVESDNTS